MYNSTYGGVMVTFERNEIVSATQLVRQFSLFLSELADRTLNKIAIIRNNEMKAVVLPIEEYERLVSSSQAAAKKSVRDYFGCISDEDAEIMMKAVSECRKVDLNEW